MPRGRPKGSTKKVEIPAVVAEVPVEAVVAENGLIALDADRERAIDIALGHIKSEYGNDGIIYTEENIEVLKQRNVYSTGFPSLDHIISDRGGIPAGRVIEAYGHKSSGKSTFAMHLAAEVNRVGLPVAYVDLENTLDLEMAKAMGVKVGTKLFLVSKPEYGEQALDVINTFARSKAFGLIVLDSVAALCPKEEEEKGVEKQTMGTSARMMSKALRILTNILGRPDNHTLVLFINQIRKNLAAWGAPNTTPGGEALPFYASVRLEFRQVEILKSAKQEGMPYGILVNIKAVKNKIHNPYGECRLKLNFGKGFDQLHDIVQSAVDLGLIEKGGAWLTYQDQKFQGEDNIQEWLLANPAQSAELQQKIHQLIRG